MAVASTRTYACCGFWNKPEILRFTFQRYILSVPTVRINKLPTNILTKSGHQAGPLPSPYFRFPNERISINGTEIPDLISLVEKAQVLLDDLESTLLLTDLRNLRVGHLLMFLYFDLKQVDMAISWSRYCDALIRPMSFARAWVICTSIGFDHTETLGNSLLTSPIIKQASCEKTHLFTFAVSSAEVEHFFNQKSYDLQAP